MSCATIYLSPLLDGEEIEQKYAYQKKKKIFWNMVHMFVRYIGLWYHWFFFFFLANGMKQLEN